MGCLAAMSRAVRVTRVGGDLFYQTYIGLLTRADVDAIIGPAILCTVHRSDGAWVVCVQVGTIQRHLRVDGRYVCCH